MSTIDLSVEDRTVRAYQALPKQGEGRGVLVLHAWWGLTPVFTDVCERLAQAGFVALAPDMFEGQTASTVEGAEKLAHTFDGEGTYNVAKAAMQHLQKHDAVRGDRLGAIGFSFGAPYALMLNGPTAAVVTFYGTGDPDSVSSGTAVQGHLAENDPYEPAEYARALEQGLRASGHDVAFYTYPGTSHWFFEANRPQYDPQAADLAWQRTLDFLRSHLS
ncbi:MAG: dienelactone hydrolase family protein [Anaerolineae bacterium]